MFFDSHAHLDGNSFGSELDIVIRRAFDEGVSGIITVGASANPDVMREALDIAARYERIYAAVGVHPHDADRATEETYEVLQELASRSDVVAIGETGLDYHYGFSSRKGQQAAFERQIELAARADKPIVVHCREAEDDCMAIISSARLPSPPGVVHCFTKGYEDAKRWLDLGFILSIPGVVTFRKNALALCDTVRKVSIDRLLVETDSPYLAPEPMRGRRNEPAFIRHTVGAIATIKGLTLEDAARVTALNARRLFGICDPEADKPKLVYPIRDSLYVNVTNRCTLRCTFCPKWRDWYVKGHNLRLGRDPDVTELTGAIVSASPERYHEVVFCGYGEPLLRPDVVKSIAALIKARGIRTRVNTDGLANLIHGRDIVEELSGLIDAMSISLNAPDRYTYARICPSRYGEDAFDAVCEFIQRCRALIPEVVATVVELPGLDIEACKRLADQVLLVPLRVRPYNEVG